MHVTAQLRVLEFAHAAGAVCGVSTSCGRRLGDLPVLQPATTRAGRDPAHDALWPAVTGNRVRECNTGRLRHQPTTAVTSASTAGPPADRTASSSSAAATS